MKAWVCWGPSVVGPALLMAGVLPPAPPLGGSGGAFAGGGPTGGALVGHALSDATSLKDLIEAKERELNELGDYRVASLEAAVRERDGQLAVASERLEKLKEDFSFNLGLIGERDAELSALEAGTAALEQTVRERDEAAEELRRCVSDMEKQLAGGVESNAARESYWATKCSELRSENDACRWAAKEAERTWRESEASLRLEWASKLKDAAEDAAHAKRDLAAALEDCGRRRDAEVRCADEKGMELARASDGAATGGSHLYLLTFGVGRARSHECVTSHTHPLSSREPVEER